MADLAERFAQLSPAQRQLLLERLGRRRPEAPPVAARSTPPAIARIPTQPRDGRPFPLSFAQQRLWFLDQLEPGKSLYNMPLFLRLRGSLALPSLGRAFAEIERRHEVLRTTFAVVDEQAVQVVGPPGPLALPLADLAGLPVTAEVAEAARLSADEAERPFDLSRGPLCRVLLLHLGERDYTLLLTLHHVVCDGWSLGVLVRELGALYGAFASGRPSPLPPLPVQYADFAVWQRQRLAGEAVAEQLDYWKRQLAGSPPLLELPTDRPRSVFPSSRGRTLPLPLPEALWSGAQALARDLCATPFIVLLAVFQSLLGRHACQSDVVVGTPVANRNRSEIEGLIGFFVNTLVLRTDLTGDPAFGELLGRVRRGVSGAYAHQDLPFERLVDELQTDRHLGHSPLFQVMFILQSDPMPAAEIAGLSLSPLPVEGTTAKFDLMLQFWEQPRGLAGFLEFTTDLFDATTVRRLGEQLETLLGSVLEHPERPLSALPLLPPAAHHQLLAEWNDTWEEPGADRPGCLHDLFAAQAERTPAAAALVWGGASWSYGELDRRAERLSRRLRRLGVGPDVPVGICLRRSPEMAVAVLGVLAAGAAYIPLDPAYPRERLARMLDLAGARVLLTQEDLRTTLPAEGVTALCLDAVEPEPEVGPVAGPEPRPDDLAYVIFTSGSTGVPKGVALPHRALVNLITWQLGESTLGAGSKTLQLASLSFDVSCQELFSTWAAGGTLVLIPEEVRLDTAALLLTLVREEVERIFLPFVALQQLAETAVERGLYPWALAEVVTAGEQLQVTGPIAELFTHLRRARLWNQYGPSESHVATAFALVGPSRSWPALPPVGTPVANARIHLLDETSRPVPLGVPGELHIGGECLARGYFRRPELTAERFVPDPVSGRGERLYRTGDLARYRADGTLEFLGRNDQQVKIRGFRVEPGEIEAALATIPGVREAVVVARDGRLVAYVARAGEPASTAAELRGRLREILPEHMVPAFFQFLPALPLTASGKVDRRALPAPEGRGSREEVYLAPRGPVEEALAKIWEEVLRRERVGAEDDFFALGGHSLLATQVISRLRRTLQVELPLKILFERPTIASLAAEIERARRGGEPVAVESRPVEWQMATVAAVPERLPLPTGADLPLSFAQERLWFIDQLEPGSAKYNIPSALQLDGPLRPAALAWALSQVERRHEALRTVFKARADRPVQVIGPAREPFPLPVVDLTGLRGLRREELAARLAGEEAGRPFDLGRGPLWRAALLRMAEERQLLLLTLHHIAADGWSMEVLVQEVAELYAAAVEGRPARLSELPIQYAKYALWQREWLRGEVLARQLAYWKRQLAGAPRALDLPTDRPRPAVQTFAGAILAFTLPADLERNLKALSGGVTLFMALLAAFQALLGRYSGQEDVVVGTPVAGRNHLVTEGLIGFFVNNLVIRTQLAGDPDFRGLLTRVQEGMLAALAHQDLPFERLVGELQLERCLSHAPLFQVVFVLQNIPFTPQVIPELRLTPLAVDNGTAKFDLTATLVPAGGGLTGTLEYNRDLFDRSTIGRLAGHFQALLAAAVAEPGRRVAELPLLAAAERHQLLAEWNDAIPAGSEPASVLHRRFAAQVARTPEALAVITEGEALSYAELATQAGRLARRLRRLGVGPEVVVGVCLERSLALVVAILGVLEAGGAYLPLDPTYPRERLDLLITDAAVPVIVTDETVASSLPNGRAVLVLLDRGGEDEGPVAPIVPVDPGVRPENLAYLIYTSGSTGRPRGVQVTHANVTRLLSSTAPWFRFGPCDVWTLFHSFAFDFSVWEIWGALAYGGTLVVVPYWVSRSPEVFFELLGQKGVTVLNQTPSAFRQLLRAEEELGGSGLPALRLVIFGGEALEVQSLRPWVARHGAERPLLVNMYGITETTVHVTYRPLGAEDMEGGGGSVIGRAIPDLELRVVDPAGEPQPIGVPGELCVAGAGLARGYAGRPELTAARFVPDPWGSEPGSRLYRSGDLVRRMPSGDLEYLGRIDHQMKVRGFRIEMGEIEAALRAEVGVREALAMVREDVPGDRRLVAYVVAGGEGSWSSGGAPVLLEALRRKLPEPLVPSAIVVLDALPLTVNGKVDRRALPAPEGRGGREEGYLAPRGLVEEALAKIWEEVLRREWVGAEDDFFGLGGHSLLATQVISRLRRTLQVELPLKILFEHPTIASLAAEVERALRGGEPAAAPPITRVARQEALPLSFPQERLWFIDQLEPGSAEYNIPAAFELLGPLRPAAFAWALGKVEERQEALRTVFTVAEGGPLQVIGPGRQPFPLPVIDLAELGAAAREERLLNLAREEAARRFDLGRGPVWRVALLRMAEEWHVLLLTLHHIAADGWSVEVLAQEVAALYKSAVDGRPAVLPELPIQYVDYASWQRGWLQGEVLARQLAYWKGRLAGAPPVLDLPTDRPRPAVRTSRGVARSLVMPVELEESLAACCRRESATLATVLLAGFAALLGRYSGQQDLTVGMPVAGRTRLETEGLIGFFVNTLVLRVDLAGGSGFASFLGEVRHALLDAYLHQDLPFEKLVEELAPERSLAHSPLFQAMFVFVNTPARPFALPGLTVRELTVESAVAKFDLTLSLGETPEGLACTLNYRTDLFEAATVERFLAHFQALLAAAVTDPRASVAELPLLAAAERHQLLAEWNDTADAAADSAPALHQLFAAQVARTPDALAITSEGEALTYAELDRRVHRLAHHLRALGVGPEWLVGVCAERSLALAVALLGVLEAGGAYVPLDPDHPRERLAWIVEEAGLAALLVEEHLAGRLPAHSVATLRLAGPETTAAQPLALLPPLRIAPEGLAYVIYTSGSTGRPKGAMNTRRAMVNRLLWMQSAYGLKTTDAVLQKTPFSFDVSVWEFFWPLLFGARLEMALPGGHQDPDYLAATIERAQITTVHFVPSMLSAFLEARGVPRCRSLRCVIASGEALSAELAASFHARLPWSELHNLYGPTEAAIDVTSWACGSGAAVQTIPIGRPITNLRIHLLDPELAPVALGIAGELYIAGAGVGRGYLGRPDLTAERFLPDPYAAVPGARMYRSGDLARHRPDGAVEYLGRIDRQVKIRGFRIELGEIEGVLVTHPGVREAVVVAREDVPGEPRLVAYVVARQGAPLDPAELSRHLAAVLPAYMIPWRFVELAALPLTASGKVSHRELPAPAGPAREEGANAAPRTPVEELLCAIWADVLGLSKVGVHDDFFTLGGHSLLATRVISRLREAFRVEMPLRVLFEAPTVEGLAARIEPERLGSSPMSQASLSPLVPLPRAGDPPLSFAQQRLWFLDRLAPDNPFYNVFGAVRLTGLLEIPALLRAFEEIVRRHEALRTTFRLADGRPVQVIAPLLRTVVPVIDLAVLPEADRRSELARLSRAEAERPFDLARGPLLRASLIRLAAFEHALLANLHHIVSDGWSLGILFAELTALYGAFSEGVPSPLPELPIQYADFAVWQRQWLAGERLAAELDYWRRQLDGMPETLTLPYDHPRPAIGSFRGATQSFVLPAGLVRELSALTRRSNATLSMTILAGFKALLGRASGQEDLGVGVAIANRTRREVEGLIGFFVNTLVLRSDLSGSPGFKQLLARVRETALAAYAHQDLPFERLVEELAPERDLGRNPLIQVMFAYQNFPRAEAEVRGVVLSLPEEGRVAAASAKFDLTLFIVEGGDQLRGTLELNREIFESTTMRRLLGHFESLLAAAVARPETPVALLPLMTVGEEHQLLLEWNDTGSSYPAAASLQELFEAQAASTSHAVALLFGESALSYGDLNRRANRLAHRLRGLGVGPESRVGLCLDRSLEMVVGLLGILKAGGAYVPLDPDYPGERLAFMLEDSVLRWLVTEEGAVTRLPGHLMARTERVRVSDISAGSPDHDPPVTTGGESLAYVIYTSGSTGRPKGVGVTHRAVARLVRGTGYAHFGPGEVFVQFAPISFDASTLEIWGALLNGARLALMPPHALSLDELGRAFERYRVTTLWLTAGLFHQFVEHRLELLRPVRQLLAGGDALSAPHVRRVLSELPGTRLINGYGPTENTTFTCCHPMQGPERISSSVPLGRAIANTGVYLLDRCGEPVPMGVAGELCTGGDGLARGYLGRPELTAERFIPNPFGGSHVEAPGSRLYRTGDLARHLPDGRIEFLGRIDQQVKVRGFRIELGEIESRLAEHPAVLENVVVAREDVPGDRSLVAYVVQNPAYEVLASEVETEQVSQWGELFDDLYGQEAADSDPTFNVIGWNSSYTDRPLPRSEMEEWLEDTVERIAALAPRRVLEIGCGTGMLLFRLAPRSELYTGTDVSGQALSYVESQLGRLGSARARVQLLRGSAERLDGIAADSFDTVIVNSVAQYFPSADYLAEVVARAVEVVRPGGSIFLGDLRSLSLLPAFHISVELFQAAPEMPLPLLRQKVEARRRHENELVIAPAFFAALKQRLPKIGRVEVYPKRGHAHNELTGFRYQVVLRLGEPEAAEPGAIPWLDWQSESLTLAALRRRLEESEVFVLGLRNVPNARVSEAEAAARLLYAEEAGIETAGDLRRRAAEAAAGAVDPQDLWDLARTLPYEVELSWSSHGPAGCFEAVLCRCDRPSDATGRSSYRISAFLPALEPEAATESLGRYTNNPLQGRFARRIAPELRTFLKERLPEHMLPFSFVLLDALPLSSNGKVDRQRLPAPDLARPETGPSLVAPRNPTEAKLAEIWRELLGVERIGLDDDFFELGGHSLLATQAVSRVREAFGVELPLRTFFEGPTVAAVAEEVAGRRLAGEDAEVPPMVPVPRDGLLPLSFAQERLWFLRRLDTRTLAYNEAAAFRLDGRLDEAALRWSLDEVLRRHESLRTTFPEVEGRAVQRIEAPAPFEIPAVDLSRLPSARRDAEARRQARAQAFRPFDLARGPLVRGLLLRFGEREHGLLFAFHHIVFDGWSTGVFVRELSALYGARIAGRPSPLLPLSIQYADFASWQRAWLQGEVLERQLAYWRERLTGVAVLGLATDRPRPVLPEAPSGHRLAVVLPALTGQLRAFSRDRGATLFMTLLAAFQALLHRYSGQDDVAVGSPIANRNRGEVEGLIGFFVNMLVLRTDLSGDPPFGELLDRVRQVALGAYAHQNLPFEKLVEELRPDRDLRRTPLFQVSFQLVNVPTSSLDLPGLTLQPFSAAARSAKFDLDLALIDEAERLSGPLDYDADLFDGTTMERLLAHLDRLLAGAVESPGSRLSELPLLTRAEQGQVVGEWNDTRAALPSGFLLNELFEAQVRRRPEAVALAFEGEELRYGELDARANQLAHRLRRLGVGPGVRVGLCVERSLELVVGLLGALKAGGAYVPLDPSYPRERLSFMLADARVPVLLTQERLLAAIQPDARGSADAPTPRVLCLDAQWEEVAAESAESPTVPGSVDELAYVIYTSGSTGRPKGVMNSHRAICNRLLWLQEVDGLTGNDRVLQKTPVSFDVSVWELFWPLVTGARLVLARPGGHQDPDYLVRLLAQAGITTAHFVPSMLQVFLEARDVESLTALRRVICSGEALTAQLEHRFFARFKEGAAPVLYNLYGPTEAAVEVTAWRCAPGGTLAAVPIGRPVANTRALVLDAHLKPVPIGIPGELYLGGVQLARGYLDRPDLTAEKFIPDPFAAAEDRGARLYRTGDQVRHLAEGEIVYLGRLDHQVKVRGFRIELGEVEAALCALPGVREAVVIARDDSPGDRRLVAYVTGEVEVEALRLKLRDRLPEFMVPTAFVPLPALPLNPSGKVDRQALPAPDRGSAPGFVAPRAPAEEVLAEIWEELLGLARVGAHDNFFERGGHSLLAVLLMARIEKRFGRALPLATLFSAPTLESLAALLSQPASPAGRLPLVAIRPQGDRAPFFCVHPVGGNVLCYLDLARHLTPDQPFYALQTPAAGDNGGRPASIEAMASRYLPELRRIQPQGPYRLGGWSMGGVVAFEMARQLASEGEELDLVALIDTLPPAVAPGREPATEDELVAWFAQDLARLLGYEMGIAPEELRPFPGREKLAQVAELGRTAGLLPEGLGLAQMTPLFETFAVNLQASRSYVSGPYAGKLTLCFSAQTFAVYGPELLDGWSRLAQGGIETRTLPGDHYGLLRPPEVELLARELTAHLDRRGIS